MDSSPTAPSLSLRGDTIAEAIHKDKAQKAGSTMLCHDLQSKSHNDRMLDSSDNALFPSLRADEIGTAIHKKQARFS